MIFLSLWVTADAEGGLKTGRTSARFYRGLGAVSHKQARLGIYRGIACRYYRTLVLCPDILNKSPAPEHQIQE